MARRRSYRRYIPRIRRYGRSARRHLLSGGLGALLAGAIGLPLVSYFAKSFVPVQHILPASLMGAGAIAYAIDGKNTGMGLIGAGLGLEVANMMFSKPASTIASTTGVWS
jgi:hypothetical protein